MHVDFDNINYTEALLELNRRIAFVDARLDELMDLVKDLARAIDTREYTEKREYTLSE